MIKKYVLPKKFRISYSLIIKLMSAFLGILIPTILAHILDNIVRTGNKNLVIIFGSIMLGAAFGEWVLGIYSNRIAARISAETIGEIRQDLFDRSIRLSQRQIDKLGISSIESRLTSDTYTIHNFLGTALRMGARSIMLFVGGIVFCILLNPKLSLIILTLIFPIFISIRYIYNKTQPIWRSLQEKVDQMVQVIRESIKGIKVSKALNMVDYEKDKFYQTNDDVRNTQIKATDIMAITGPFVNIILYSGVGLVIYLGGKMVNSGEIKVGTIIAFTTYFLQITQSLFMLNWMFNIYSKASTSMKRIDEILFMDLDENQIVENEVKLPKSDSKVPEIEFRNVSFAYDGTNKILENISFSVFPGNTLSIMGATGSGKSTIIKLLLRQYDVSEGEILVRGINIKNIGHDKLNSLFGSVFQRDFLFKGSIKENISFGRDLDDYQIKKATENAQASEFIFEKEEKLEHQLASKGVNLSGGQKQRVLISRAFANDPEILILDDSSSALDYKTDAKLRTAIDENYSNSTSIVIAQRISTVINSDEIIFLEKGRILAKGKHEYMLENCLPYREIAEMQIGEEVTDGE